MLIGETCSHKHLSEEASFVFLTPFVLKISVGHWCHLAKLDKKCKDYKWLIKVKGPLLCLHFLENEK